MSTDKMKEDSGRGSIGRRQFLTRGGGTILGLAIPPILKSYAGDKKLPSVLESSASTAEGYSKPGYQDMLRRALQYRKIDAHNHVDENTRKAVDIVRSCDRVGIGHAAVSIPNGKSPQEIRNNNNIVLKAMKEFPKRILGQCYINPNFKKESIEEINRCVGEGMVMLGELYNAVKINDPLYYPIIERCIELKIPLLMHATSTFANWWKGYPPPQPTTASVGEDFVAISRRYPEAMIIHGHIGGGGIWEYVCKVMQDAPNVYIDTSGSVCDEAMIDMAIQYIGADRLLFATDVNFESGVGKIMWAKLTEEQRKKIFFDNFNNLLKKAGNHVD
jgi:uncharacterized protein